MGMKRSKNHPLECVECGKNFKAFRPTDKFCSSSCRWKHRDRQPHRKEQKAAQHKHWRSWNFDYRRNYMLKYTYGITQQQYEEMLADQGGGCAICGKTPEEEGKNLAVDHDHKTGEIFGILCTLCNKILIGRTREASAFERAAEYLRGGTGLFVPQRKKTVKRKPKRG